MLGLLKNRNVCHSSGPIAEIIGCTDFRDAFNCGLLTLGPPSALDLRISTFSVPSAPSNSDWGAYFFANAAENRRHVLSAVNKLPRAQKEMRIEAENYFDQRINNVNLGIVAQFFEILSEMDGLSHEMTANQESKMRHAKDLIPLGQLSAAQQSLISNVFKSSK